MLFNKIIINAYFEYIIGQLTYNVKDLRMLGMP
jgi:hypothetical protein